MKKLFALFLLLVVAGCGGGGGSGSTTSGGGVTPDTVSGVAAAGVVISGTVYLKDSAVTPKELSKTIAADGSYSFDVTGMTKPYLLRAVGTANGTSYTLYSMAADKGTANINPMTNLVVASAAGGADVATIYNAPQASTVQAMAGKLTQAVTDVQTSLNALLLTHNSATVNPISDNYKADHTGLDGMFDLVKVNVSNGTVTITNASTSTTIFTAQASNIKGGTLTSGNISVLKSPAFSSANGVTFTIGTVGSFTVTTTGNPKPTLSISGTLPTGVTFDATTGMLGGTPATGTSGTFNLTFTAKNGSSPDATQSFTLTISAQTPFIPTGKMIVARSGYSSTPLPSGKVLIVGGDSTSAAYPHTMPSHSTSEIYDPVTGTFALSGQTLSDHSKHLAILLNNGKVLICGGSTSGKDQSGDIQLFNISTGSAELYDPKTGTFAATGSMTPLYDPASNLTDPPMYSATLLKNGKVLIMGIPSPAGRSAYTAAYGQIYDPDTGVFTMGDNWSYPRNYHTATLLSNGNVLITGGFNPYYIFYPEDAFLQSAEIYDPLTSKFIATGNMSIQRMNHTATLLPDGNVLITGGKYVAEGDFSHYVVTATAEIYNPSTGAFTPTGSMNKPRAGHTATLLSNGKVLIVGGDSSSEIYDPITKVFTSIGSMPATFSSQSATRLNTGNILITGTGGDVELYLGLK